MAGAISNYYKKEEDKVIFTGDGELIYYVPEKYFELKVAESVGDIISTMGIFTYGLYDKNGKQIRLNRVKCETMLECRPSLITKEKNFLLNTTKTATDYRLLHFKKGDELIVHRQVPAVIDNVNTFFRLSMGANLPENIPYDEMHNYILNNASNNNFKYKAPPQVIGVYVSELCRDPNNMDRPFRCTDMKDMCGYKSISINQAPKYASPYTAITSENGDEAIAAAMTTKGTAYSPLEPIMMESAFDVDDFFDEEISYDKFDDFEGAF